MTNLKRITSSEKMSYLRALFGGQEALADMISKRRSRSEYKLTVMAAVDELYAEAVNAAQSHIIGASHYE